MTTRLFIPVSIMLLALLLAPVAPADTTITLDGTRGVANTVIQVKGDMARLTQAGQPFYALYDRNRNMAIYVDSARQEYSEIDKPTLDKYAGVMAAMRQQMEQMRARLQMLPPAQRAMLEQQMEKMMGAPASGLPGIKDMRTMPRGRRTVGGFGCRVHALSTGQRPVGEVCLATAAEAGVSRADFATLMAMMDFLRDLAGVAQNLAGGMDESAGLLLSGLQGVPVAAKDYQGGREFMVAGVTDTELDGTLFSGYQAYRKQDIMDLISTGR